MTTADKIDEATRRELAVRAEVDPRTIQKILQGKPVRGMPGRRARAALEAAGFAIPDPSPTSAPTKGLDR